MYYKSHKNDQEGFTLVELLIAIAVFGIGIMAAFTLALGNWRTDKENYNRVMAGNLSREGIELVRHLRDSNWLKMDNNEECDNPGFVCKWDSYMDNVGNRRFLIDYESIHFVSPIKVLDVACNNTLEECIENCNQGSSNYCVLQYDFGGDFDERFFYHDNGTNDHLTNFKRVIDLEAICYDGTAEEVANDDIGCDVAWPGYEKIGLKVTSIVGWDSFGTEENTKATEYLYNWRR